MADQCPHQNIAIDRTADTSICRDCGLVMMDRPSICCESEVSTLVSIPPATRQRVFEMASRLHISVHHALNACRHIRDVNGSVRHPATLAACLLETPGVSMSLKDASAKLSISIRSLRRAVSRLRRQKIKC
jgi:hypothetical protein